ncbi:MAG: L-rhamnose isomerase [Spirochaetales bacterium]|nr:L-rhamnose isomerase [Spirochaetales bacterium]MCF7938327.1 L-rhamnose isomerase [Spirochaetales bacterium]
MNSFSDTRKPEQIEESYQKAKERYAAFGIDTDAALGQAASVPISLHCWQGDDVTGFEGLDELGGGGIMATGSFPGKARGPAELRGDLEEAISLIPGELRVNLHVMYGESGGKKVDRDEYKPEHFRNWIDWAKKHNLGIDMNPTFFSHEKAEDGFTLSSKDPEIRKFWIRHSIASRKIAEAIGRELGTPSINNFWIPDGYKDFPADRIGHRRLLTESLDEIFDEKLDPEATLDAVESKLFGIGSEAFVSGSHEFYLAYAVSRQIMLCFDAGHFHPTESIADKLSSSLLFLDRLLLHVSRPMRWDSDHVVLFDDDTRAIAREALRAAGPEGLTDPSRRRIFFALDFFDASINRIGAWVTGTRAARKSLLAAFLEPYALLKEAEESANFGERLALLEESKTLPFSAVWDKLCMEAGVPVSSGWIDNVRNYEAAVLRKR